MSEFHDDVNPASREQAKLHREIGICPECRWWVAWKDHDKCPECDTPLVRFGRREDHVRAFAAWQDKDSQAVVCTFSEGADRYLASHTRATHD